jgi:hypothetical protein
MILWSDTSSFGVENQNNIGTVMREKPKMTPRQDFFWHIGIFLRFEELDGEHKLGTGSFVISKPSTVSQASMTTD